MPFGLCNAPATFQRCMMAIFSDFCEKICEVFMDDFSVYGSSFDDCLSNLDRVLQRCEETNLVLNWEKCHFMVNEGIVLGHKISERCIEVDKSKDAAQQVESLMIEADALVEAKKLSIDQLENICRILFNTNVDKQTTAEMKRDVLVFAKNNPEDFLDICNDPELKIMGTVQSFFDKGSLTYRKSKKEVWFNTPTNKTKMLNVPFGSDGLDMVVSYLQTDEGIEVLKYLETV